MKKLSFFLMAMLISVMSFAAESLQVTLDFSKNTTWGFPNGSSAKTTATKTYTNGDYSITLAGGGNGNGHYFNSDGYLIYGKSGATLTLPAFSFKTTKIVVTGRSGASGNTKQNFYVGATAVSTETTGATGTYTYKIAADYQAAGNVYIYKVTSSHNTQITKIQIYGEAESGEQTETVNAPKFDVTESNFTEAFTLNLTSDEGTTLKYTTDNTNPKTSETAIEVNTNSVAIAIPAKSTAVQAVAVKGELMSVSASMVYCYVNSAATAYTVAEAIEVINSGLGLDNELYAKGEIYKIDSYNETYKSITYWIKDEANNQLQVYSGRGLNNTDFASKDDLVVGSKVVICGILKKYNSTYEFDKTNYIVSLTLPSYTVTATAENGSVEGLAADGKYEHGAEATLTATAAEGYEFTCWTSGEDTVSTANPYKFTVTADVTLVANFKEAEPTYDLELVAKDLYSASDEVKTQFEGSNSLNPDMTISVTLFASKYGTYTSTGAEEDEFNAFYAGSQILGELTYSYSDELKSDLVVIIGTITDEEETSTIKVTMYEEYLEPTDVVVLNNLQKNVQKMGWMSNLMLFNAANDTIITISGCDGTYGKYSAWGTFGADELEGKGEWKNDGENDVFVGVLYNADKTKVFQVTATTPAEKIKEYTYELADVSFTLSEVSNTLIIEAYAEEPEPVQVYLELAGWTPEQTIYAVGEMSGSIANMDNIEGADVANLTYEVESYLEGKELTITAQVEDAAGNTYLLILTGEYDSTTTALDNLNTTVAPVKMIENGQLIIINNGVQFNAQGQVIK